MGWVESLCFKELVMACLKWIEIKANKYWKAVLLMQNIYMHFIEIFALVLLNKSTNSYNKQRMN